MSSNMTTVAYIYKRLYSDEQVGDIAQREHPLMSMCSKKGGFTGTSFHYPIRYGNPQGIGADFTKAQANVSASKGVQLAALRYAKYGLITLDGEAMAAAEGNKGAFLELVKQETEGVLEEMGDHMSYDLFRSGSGSRGRRASAATNVITLATVDDARNFKVGMTVLANDTDNATGPRAGSTTVTAVDEDAGTVTLASAAAITSFADNDYLFADGDEGSCVEGLAAHFPLTAPVFSSDSFRGIDRGADPRRLSGVRVDDSGSSILENAGLCAIKIAQVGKKADCLFLNPINFWKVVRQLNAKVEYSGGGGSATAFFSSFVVSTPAGDLKCYSDPDCPIDRGYVLNKKTMYIKHLKGFPHIIRDDGRPNLRQAAADGIEARARAWWNLVVTMPGANGVFSI